MEGARRGMMINGGVSSWRATYGRPIPRRGRVKAAMVVVWPILWLLSSHPKMGLPS
ncbi:hypothetical protein Acr_18g0004180 [Actinidia rufa]|uniref:Uncharacterized protein n=1 Tax=Actinidia rufa TaxID=165716 RepID=A0A7J0G633_9ERIC|nr:hypothetical protein Acr_18g0004180 [Actinidia rufa]